MMNNKHFREIAQIINVIVKDEDISRTETINHLINSFSGMCKDNNSNFDYGKFDLACRNSEEYKIRRG